MRLTLLVVVCLAVGAYTHTTEVPHILFVATVGDAVPLPGATVSLGDLVSVENRLNHRLITCGQLERAI